MKALLGLLLVLFWVSTVPALDRFPLEPGETVVGEIEEHTLSGKETLLDVARFYGLGYNQLILANPGVDPWVPPAGRKIVLPRMYVLPVENLSGLIVNLPEMRLYYYRVEGGKKVVYTAPIGIGTEGKLTPEGLYLVYRKKEKPYWHVPESIREEDPTLPPVVPPGPDNPLGEFALYLSRGAYAIHGTNKPWGIGRRVSHGCIRLYPEDIQVLYPLVPVGTPVKVLYQPFKLGVKGTEVYLQAFPDLEKRFPEPLKVIIEQSFTLQKRLGRKIRLDFWKVKQALKKKDGLPYLVGTTGEASQS